MNILLVNDDGYDAKGIRLIKDKLSKYGNVTVLAPKTSVSAKSCSLTIRDGMSFAKEEEGVYSLTGFPADCVAFALHGLNQKYDLVVSGCNHGYNISYDTLYSGTIGACLEALKNKIPSIAFSCDFNFDLVDEGFDEVMDYILKNDLLSKEYFLNVNFPSGDKISDIRLSRVYYRNDHHFFTKDEKGLYWAKRDNLEDVKDENTDCYMVTHDIVSITPMTAMHFDESIFQKLLSQVKKS